MKINKEKIIIFSFGAAAAAYSFTFKGREGWAVSPALFCIACGVLIMVLSLFLKPENSKENKAENSYSLVNPALFVLSIVVWSLFLGKIHFVIITSVLLLVLGVIMKKQKPLDNILWAVFISFLIYFIFNTVFKVRL